MCLSLLALTWYLGADLVLVYRLTHGVAGWMVVILGPEFIITLGRYGLFERHAVGETESQEHESRAWQGRASG